MVCAQNRLNRRSGSAENRQRDFPRHRLDVHRRVLTLSRAPRTGRNYRPVQLTAQDNRAAAQLESTAD
jgi:hypothetical protein